MDEFVNDIYRKKLEERGFDFRAFSHVDAEFVNQMADLMPDIILMGLIMDGIDGYKLTEALKNDPRTKDIHIIGFSNLTGKEEIEKCFRLGMDDYWVMSELTPQQVFAKLYDWTKLIRYQKDGMFKGKDERLEEIMEHLRNKKYE
jgi:CheY-like chemotaxis protein